MELLTITTDKLIIAANVRRDTKITKTFISNVKKHGILNPILVRPSQLEDGKYDVIDGQRRTLAAIEGGLTELPAIVRPIEETTGNVTAASRITEQLIVNDQREQLTDFEHADAYRELSLFGMSADAIARNTNTPRKRVDQALTIVESPKSAELLEHVSKGVTLEHAAAIVEFEDMPELAAELTKSATEDPARFDHVLSRIRSDRAEIEARLAVESDIAAAGMKLVNASSWNNKTEWVPASELYTGVDGWKSPTLEEILAVLPADHEDLGAYPVRKHGVYNQDHGHYESDSFHIGYAVRNPTTHGWRTSSIEKRGPLTDAEKTKRAHEREQGKRWAAATDVRIAWIREYLQRRSFLVTPQVVIAQHMAKIHLNYNSTQTSLMHSLLGLEPVHGYNVRTALQTFIDENPQRADNAALAVVFGYHEGQAEYSKKGWSFESTPEHLTALVAFGYGPSEIEEEVLAAHAKKVAAK